MKGPLGRAIQHGHRTSRPAVLAAGQTCRTTSAVRESEQAQASPIPPVQCPVSIKSHQPRDVVGQPQWQHQIHSVNYSSTSQHVLFHPAQTHPYQAIGEFRGGGRAGKPPPEAEKIVLEKWCYFRRLYF